MPACRHPRRLAVVAAVLVAVVGLLGATFGTAGAAASSPSEVRIGYQAIPNGDLVVKHEGWLEHAFGKDVKVRWVPFASGGLVNEAVAAGTIDLGAAGSSPVARGISTGVGYRVPWIFDVIGTGEALVARAGITTVAGLAGHTIAVPRASTAHESLLAALQDAGVAPGAVRIVFAEPEAIASAWTRGEIDAAYVWNPVLGTLAASGGHTLVTSADLAAKGHTTYDLGVVADAFARRYPGAVRTWVTEQQRAVALIRNRPARAVAAIAAELGVTPEQAKAQLAGVTVLDAPTQSGPKYLGGGLGDDLYATARFNADLGEIATVRPEADYADAVTDAFVRSARSASRA